MKVLTGDIGGTKTLLRIVEINENALQVLHEKRYLSQDFTSFDTLISEYLHDVVAIRRGITCACFGVAGPVRHDLFHSVAHITNLPWMMDSRALAALTAIKIVYLINDFEAIGFGIGRLGEDQLTYLQKVPAARQATQLLVGAGTGLGVGLLLWDNGLHVLPSQGGHVAFAPENPLEDALLHYLRPRLARVSWEHVVSGPGLVRLYEFLYGLHPADDALYEQIMASDDRAAAITTAAAADNSLCRRALSLFIRLYGRITGDLALVGLPFGGIFLAGGIAPKIVSGLADETFMEAFRAKGPMTSLMDTFPVAVVLDPFVGINGAAVYAASRA